MISTVSSIPLPSGAFPLKPPDQKYLVTQPTWPGYDAVVKRLEDLTRLPVGWNGYRAGPVSFASANFALEMLRTVCNSAIGAPQIVPGPNGDLQAEWHGTAGSIELHVLAPNRVEASRDLTTGEVEDLELTTDFTRVVGWLREFSGLSGAAHAAAA